MRRLLSRQTQDRARLHPVLLPFNTEASPLIVDSTQSSNPVAGSAETLFGRCDIEGDALYVTHEVAGVAVIRPPGPRAQRSPACAAG